MRKLLLAAVSALGLLVGNPALAQFTASSPLNFSANFNKNSSNGQIGIQYWDNWTQDPFPVRSYSHWYGSLLPAVNNGDVVGWRSECSSQSTGIAGALDTGWSNMTCGRINMLFMHGTNTGAQKTTDFAFQVNNTIFGAAQSFGIGVTLNSLASHDHQNIVISNTYFGGIASSGDEGVVGYGMSMSQPAYHNTAHVFGNIVRGSGSAHTTAALTASNQVQAIPVDSTAGFAVNEWVVINTTSPAYNTGYKQAMKITAVGPGNTISGLVEVDQVTGVPITPATLIPLNIQQEWADYGEHRWVVLDNGAQYLTGTTTFTYPDTPGSPGSGSPTGSGSAKITGSGTAFANNMVGGDSNAQGCFSQDSDTNQYGAPAWFPIQSVDSPTQLTLVINRQTDPVPATGAAYHVKPCAQILRVLGFDVVGVPNPGYLVVETNNFAWPNNGVIETAYGPTIGANGATYNAFSYLPESRVKELILSEEGQIAPSGSMFQINNYGQKSHTISGTLQSSFIQATTVRDASGVNPVIGTGIFMSQMKDGATFAYYRGINALDHYGIFNNQTSEDSSTDFFSYRLCCSVENDVIWNFTDRAHTWFGGYITDNSTRTDNKLISIKYDNGTTGGPQERFAVDTAGNILKGQFPPGSPGLTLPLITAMPFVLPGDGSFGANGAFTLNNPLDTAYAISYMYFPANAIGSGVPAGWYYCEGATPTTGTCWNNQYSGSGTPIRYYGLPSRVPFSTTGTTYSQTINTAIPAITYTVPANALAGAHAAYRTTMWVSTPADTNNKVWQLTYGGQIVGTGFINNTNQFGQRASVVTSDAGDVQFTQISNYAQTDNGNNNTLPARPAMTTTNSTVAQPLSVTLSISSGASFMVQQFMGVEYLNTGS